MVIKRVQASHQYNYRKPMLSFLIALCIAMCGTLFSKDIYAKAFRIQSSDSLVVVVHDTNTISALSKKELIDIYMGRFKNFPNGSSATPIDYVKGSDQRKEFYQRLVGKSERKIDAYWSRLLFSGRATRPGQATSIAEIEKSLQQNPSAIAYISAANVTEEMKIVYQFD